MNIAELLKQGHDKAEKQDYQGAIEFYNQVIKLDINNEEVYYDRGIVYLKIGNYQKSLDDFTQTLRLNDKHLKAYINRGDIYLKLGDNQGAIIDYSQALRLEPKNANIYDKIAIAYTQLGDKVTAIKNYKQAAKLFAEANDMMNSERSLKMIAKLTEIAKAAKTVNTTNKQQPKPIIFQAKPKNKPINFNSNYTIYNLQKKYKSFIERHIINISSQTKLTYLIIILGFLSIINSLVYDLETRISPTMRSRNLSPGLSITDIYSQIPNIRKCQEGIVKDNEKQKILQEINELRSLHGLKPVIYNSTMDNEAAKAALIFATNDDVNYNNYSPLKCWAELGKPKLSNTLYYGIFYHATVNSKLRPDYLYNSSEFLPGMLMDSRRNKIGDTTILLNPFLNSIAFGRMDDIPGPIEHTIYDYDGKPIERVTVDYVTGIAIKYIDIENQDLSDINEDFVAYPYKEYPEKFFKKGEYTRGYPIMSFSVFSNKKSLWHNQNVDFSSAIIEIRGENGKLLEINNLVTNNRYTGGLPNLLQWRVSDMKKGIKYTVNIKNVKINSYYWQNYEYWFKIK